MKIIKKILITSLSLIITAVVLVTFYLFADTTLGIIALGSAYALLFAVFILTLVGLIKGNVKFLDIEGRFNFLLILTYTLVTSALLLITWSVNYQLQEELGSLSFSEKIGLISGDYWFNDKKIESFTQDYPVRKVEHVTFTYHPNTEKQVEVMATTLGAITQLEREIYGRVIEKSEPLEVSVLRDADDYDQLNPNLKIAEAGFYNSMNKQAMVYHDATAESGDDLFVVETFVHEYSHYLFDLFLEEEGLDQRDVPVWFNEGIAEYIRNRVVSTFRVPYDFDQDLSYLDLHTQNSWNKAQSDADVYYQAQLGVEYIIGHKGDLSALSDILLDQKETDSFTRSFEQTTDLKLADLQRAVNTLEHDLYETWETWSVNRDFEKAESLYKDILGTHPYNGKIWHQYALMHEQQENWEEALAARQKQIRISPDSEGLINTSYLLVLKDSEEAVIMAEKAFKAADIEPYGINRVLFYEQWLEDISRYHELMTEEKYREAYDSLTQSENMFYYLPIFDELEMKINTLE